MTLKEMEAYLQENPFAAKKFEKLTAEIVRTTEEEFCESMSKAAAEIGCDVHPLEFALKAMSLEPLDDDELKKVSGGADWCWFDYCCHYTLKHPDNTEEGDACMADYTCLLLVN